MNGLLVRGMMVGGYGGGYMGGSPSGMGGEESGMISSLMSTMPSWLQVVVTAAAVILGALFLGWVIGQVVGRVMYPDPNKPSVLNKKERTIYIGVLAAAMVLIVILALPKKEKPAEPAVDPSISVNGEVGNPGGDGSILDDGALNEAGGEESAPEDEASEPTDEPIEGESGAVSSADAAL